MQFPKSLHAEGWREQMPAQKLLPDITVVSRDADSISPPLQSRQRPALVLIAAVCAVGASAGLNLIDDPRPLDVQLSNAMVHAGETLKDWQHQLSRGLQVSMRAVADGSEHPPVDTKVVAQAAPSARPAADDQPVKPGEP